MKQMLSERTAATLVALTERPPGLRLAELAKLTGSPLSSAQRTVEALLDEGLSSAKATVDHATAWPPKHRPTPSPRSLAGD